jgi:micrococcal nuclease
MMRFRPAVMVMVVLTATACPRATGTSASPIGEPRDEGGAASGTVVPVTKVTDGDTIHVTYHGADERVRLIGVNTPEVDWYGGTAECFGSEAGLYARGRLTSRTVRLVFDAERRDRYSRLLAYVYVGRELFNLTLVRQGYARADPVPPDTTLASSFRRAADQARAAGKGLWSACPT